MMRPQKDILETCLERLAQGDTIEACLADYPQQADELRPLLQAAQQLHTLPSRQPSAAADRRIEQRLRRAVRQRDQVMIGQRQRPFSMENVMRSIMRLLPRVALGVAALGLIVFLIARLPWQPEMEPMASSTAIAETDQAISASLDLSADPGEVPLYRITSEPVPDTPEAMLAWARDFGLPDPAVYKRSSLDDPYTYVIGSDGRRLVFPSGADSTGEIVYADPEATQTGDPTSFAEASERAVTFLREHNLLPTTYQVDEPLLDSMIGPGFQRVVIRAAVPEGVIGELNGNGGAMDVLLAANGQVAFASLRRLVVETADTVPIISAQEAYEKMLTGQTRGTTYSSPPPSDQVTYTSVPGQNWQVGQEVNVMGQVELFVNVNDGTIQASLSHPSMTNFQLTGPLVAELAEANWPGAHQIQGILTAQLNESTWELEVQDWQQVDIDDMSCLVGQVVRQGDDVKLRTDDGNEYGLLWAPTQLADGERAQVCVFEPVQPGVELDWSIIHAPFDDSPPFLGGGGGGGSFGVVTESNMAVEGGSEIAVTRVVSPMVSGGGSGSSPAVESGVPLTVPQSPHNVGDHVEMIGFVQGMRIVDDAGASRLELQLINDEDSDYLYSGLPYTLVASDELLEEMAATVDLHIRVVGQVVDAPDRVFFTTPFGLGIAVESFERVWPEEKLTNYLGHFTVEELEGEQRLIFTDHATNQRYVTNPQQPVMMAEGDLTLSEAQLLLTAVTNPAMEPVAGLPVMISRSLATGTDIATATDVNKFQSPTANRIGIVNEAMVQSRGVSDDEVIDRVELVYPYDPYASQTSTEGQLVRPLWVFYGHNAEGNSFFTRSVLAVK